MRETNLNRQLSDLAIELAQQEKTLAALDTGVASNRTHLQEVKGKLENDVDINSIGVLIEITGKEYKGKRDELVGNATAFIDEAIKQFNSCIGRFTSLEHEVTDFSTVADNLVHKYFVLIKGSEKAYENTDDALKAREKEKDGLAGPEKGVESPALAKANEDIKLTKEFLNVFLPNQNSAVNFRRILAERQGEFTGLLGLVQGKRHDAEELRTNGAVAVASQLVMTLKALEASIADQKTNTMRNMLSSFSRAAQQATSGVLESLVSDGENKNVRMMAALKNLVRTKNQLDEAIDEILSKRTDEAGLNEAMIIATDEVTKSASNLKNTVADGARAGKEAVADGAAQVIVDKIRASQIAPPSP